MSRTARLLEILITLRSGSRFTVQQMAATFGVSRRTMLRDLHALAEMGVPLHSTPGPGGGYALAGDRRLPPLSLGVDEALGVLLSYEAFLRQAQAPFTAQSLSAVTKLRAALPPDVVRELDRIRRHVGILERPSPYQAPILNALLQAALDRTHLRAVYDSMSGISDRLIFSVRVVRIPGVLVLCLLRSQARDEPLASGRPVSLHRTSVRAGTPSAYRHRRLVGCGGEGRWERPARASKRHPARDEKLRADRAVRLHRGG